MFPLIGVQVKPKKGAAVFWWNLRTDGRGDPWTRHAGCSVLYGNKWSKWIFLALNKIRFNIYDTSQQILEYTSTHIDIMLQLYRYTFKIVQLLF